MLNFTGCAEGDHNLTSTDANGSMCAPHAPRKDVAENTIHLNVGDEAAPSVPRPKWVSDLEDFARMRRDSLQFAAGTYGSGLTTVRMTILPDGRFRGACVFSGSGKSGLDEATVKVFANGRLPTAPPKSNTGPTVLYFTMKYVLVP